MKPQTESAATPPDREPSREWTECDVFCIAGYAGLKQRCGWRGRLHETVWDDVRGLRVCPRCHGATLLDIREPAAVGHGITGL